jgi:hypothetical protein
MEDIERVGDARPFGTDIPAQTFRYSNRSNKWPTRR